jgi:hypothetical protein
MQPVEEVCIMATDNDNAKHFEIGGAMFSDLENQQARKQLAAIAHDRAASLKPEEQKKALRWITAVFKAWKLEQASSDGTIEIVPSHVEGLMTLGNLGDPRPKRIPVATLSPHQCAGPGVRCPFDLWLKLSSEQYAPIKAVEAKLQMVDLIAALLVARDYKTMPISSIVLAAHLLWKVADLMQHEYLKMLDDKGAKEAKRATQQANARVLALARKATNAQVRKDTIKQMGIDYFQKNLTANNRDAAAHIYKGVKDWKEFSGMTQNGIERKLSGVKTKALAILAGKAR